MVVQSLFVLSVEEETAGKAEQPAVGFTAAGAGQAASRGGEKSEGTGEREESTAGPIQPAAGQRAAGTVRLKFNLISVYCVCCVCDHPGQSCRHVGFDWLLKPFDICEISDIIRSV